MILISVTHPGLYIPHRTTSWSWSSRRRAWVRAKSRARGVNLGEEGGEQAAQAEQQAAQAEQQAEQALKRYGGRMEVIYPHPSGRSLKSYERGMCNVYFGAGRRLFGRSDHMNGVDFNRYF